jgi:hypothetical protein
MADGSISGTSSSELSDGEIRPMSRFYDPLLAAKRASLSQRKMSAIGLSDISGCAAHVRFQG